MESFAILSLLFLVLSIVTLVGMSTKRLTHRYYLYFSLIFLGSSLLAFANSSYAGNFGDSARILSVLLFFSATLGLLTAKTKKGPAVPAKPDKSFTSKKVRTYSDKKADSSSKNQASKNQDSKNRKPGKK